MSAYPRRVLVVEDESAQRLMYERAITRMGFSVGCADSTASARRLLEDPQWAVVVLDLNLAGESGMTLFEELRDQHPASSVVIATGYGTFEIATGAIRMDVVDFLSKPVSLADLELAIERAWSRHVLVRTPIAELVPPHRTHEGGAADESRVFRDRNSLNIEDVERDLIAEALRRCDNNRKSAALMLGISERKLYYRLSQFMPRPPGDAERRQPPPDRER